MEINIRYFGQLIEIAEKENEVVRSDNDTLDSFLEEHYQKKPELKEKVFVVFLNNKKVEHHSIPIKNNDNVALMPPFAGG